MTFPTDLVKNATYALDLGTTKFCIARALNSPKSLKPTYDIVSVPAGGMRRGMLADFNHAKTQLSQLVELAEEKFNCDIRNVVVGVSGSHINGFNKTHITPVMEESITEKTIHRSNQEFKNILLKDGINPIYLTQTSSKIDGREWSTNPIGLTGSSLTTNYFAISSNRHYLNDIVRLCNDCGLEIDQIYPEQIASCKTLNLEEKKGGVILADIGGGTTDGVVYWNRKPIEVFTVNIGGKLMTNDLGIGLNISEKEAENIKKYFGLDPTQKGERYVNDHLSISFEDYYPILAARVLELTNFIKLEIDSLKHISVNQIVLTGGGSEVLNICEFFTKHSEISTIKACPQIESSREDSSTQELTPKFSTVIGLLQLELSRKTLLKKNSHRKFHHRIWNSIRSFVRELS